MNLGNNRITMTDTKLKIGILGAGVAGLAAAWDLTRAGHDVELFEAACSALRELIDAEAPQPFAHVSNAGIARDLEHRATHFVHGFQLVFPLFGVGSHGAEFINGERRTVQPGPQLPK